MNPSNYILGSFVFLVLFAISFQAPAFEDSKKVPVWPAPLNMTIGNESLWLDEFRYGIKLASNSSKSTILKKAASRTEKFVRDHRVESFQIDWPYSPSSNRTDKKLPDLIVTVESLNETLYLGVDESYHLFINSSVAELKAKTVFGALHGLSTFAQLVSWDGTGVSLHYTPIEIYDKPRFPWRGLMIDTSRHFLEIDTIKNIIDSISYVKMNVLHWHLTDAESISFEITSHPNLTAKGAWHEDAIYTQKQIKEILLYAKERGIRVVPEVDTPGHTYSFGKAYPEMIVNCSEFINKVATYPRINSVPLNVTNDDIYDILKDVYQEVAELFDDDYMHIGGDEVSKACFDEFKDYFEEWRRKHNMTTHEEMINYFRLKLTPHIVETKKKMIVWQETLREVYGLPDNPLTQDNTVVHIWEREDWEDELNLSLNRGYKSLLSGGWYLDQQTPAGKYHYLYIDTWIDFYEVEPLIKVENETAASLFLGGEACQWGEAVNTWSIESTIWPRAAATAERLWSPRERNNSTEAYHRISRLTCYLNQRGVKSNPIRPNHCWKSPKKSLFAGGMKVSVPAWVLVIIATVIVTLTIALIVVSVRYRKSKQAYEPLN